MLSDLFFLALGVILAVTVTPVYKYAADLVAKAKAAYAARKV